MKSILASVLALALAAGQAFANGAGGVGAGGVGGSGVGGNGVGGLPGTMPGSVPNGVPPLPPGSGANPGAPAPVPPGPEKPESKATAGVKQASAALREAFAHAQEGMSRGIAQAVEAIQISVK